MKSLRIVLSLILCAVLLLSCAAAENGPIVVSLGDSYSSGEGTEPFYGQDLPLEEKVHNQDWLAHRSEKSWPGQLRFSGLEGTLSDHRGIYVPNDDGGYTLVQDGNWFFVAASGALTKHFFEPMEKKVSIKKKGVSIKDTMSLYPQLYIFDALAADNRQADYVTVTIGGNDVDFPGLMAMAVMDGPLFTSIASRFTGDEQGKSMQQAIDGIWATFYDKGGVRERIKNAYLAIAAAAGEQATIIVPGYPVIASEEGELFVGGKSAHLLAEASLRFNDELEALVGELQAEGVRICFVSVKEAFDGKEAYAPGENYINGLILTSMPEDLTSRSLFSMYSFHPNAKGTAAYARCVQAKIDELEAAS